MRLIRLDYVTYVSVIWTTRSTKYGNFSGPSSLSRPSMHCLAHGGSIKFLHHSPPRDLHPDPRITRPPAHHRDFFPPARPFERLHHLPLL